MQQSMVSQMTPLYMVSREFLEPFEAQTQQPKGWVTFNSPSPERARRGCQHSGSRPPGAAVSPPPRPPSPPTGSPSAAAGRAPPARPTSSAGRGRRATSAGAVGAAGRPTSAWRLSSAACGGRSRRGRRGRPERGRRSGVLVGSLVGERGLKTQNYQSIPALTDS